MIATVSPAEVNREEVRPLQHGDHSRRVTDSASRFCLGVELNLIVVFSCRSFCLTLSHFRQTLNTLQYANRAKNIKNKPVINRDPMSQKLDLLRGRIKELEAELEVYRSGMTPTPDQLAQFAALGESIAAGLGPVSTSSVVGSHAISHHPMSHGSSSVGGVGAYSSSTPHTRHSSTLDHLPSPLSGLGVTVGVDEIAVKAEEWAATKEQLVHFEVELRKMHQRNAKLRQDVNTKNEEKLRILTGRDAWRRKVELLADKFPDVKAHLEDEKAQLEKETPTASSPPPPGAQSSPTNETTNTDHGTE